MKTVCWREPPSCGQQSKGGDCLRKLSSVRNPEITPRGAKLAVGLEGAFSFSAESSLPQAHHDSCPSHFCESCQSVLYPHDHVLEPLLEVSTLSIQSAPEKGNGSEGQSEKADPMALTVERSESSVVLRGPEGKIVFERSEFSVLYESESVAVVKGPFDEGILLQPEARKLRVEYYGLEGVYVVKMTNKHTSGYAPTFWDAINRSLKKAGLPVKGVTGNGAEAFRFDSSGGGGKENVFAPDHPMFEKAEHLRALAQGKKGFYKVNGMIAAEVESDTDSRNPNLTNVPYTTHQKMIEYVQSGQVEYGIGWFQRTKDVCSYSRDPNGNIKATMYHNPEYISLDDYPGGKLKGHRLYLSELRMNRLWDEYRQGETLNIDGTPRPAALKTPPVDPVDVQQRQIFFEDTLYPAQEGDLPGILADAARYGNLEDLHLVVAHFRDVNQVSKDGRLGLVEAVMSGDLDKVTVLLQHGASVEELDAFGRSAANMAVALGRPAANVLAYLQAQGFTMPTVTECKDECYDWVKRIADHPRFQARLLEEVSSAVEEFCPGTLYQIVESYINDGKAARLERLLNTAAGKQLVGQSTTELEPYVTALVSAALKGKENVLGVLRSHGLIDIRGTKGETPLMRIAGGANLQALMVLLRAGAGLEVEDEQGLSALGHAYRSGTQMMVNALLSRGAEEKDLHKDFQLYRAMHGNAAEE